MTNVSLIFGLVVLLFIWFDTDAVVEWARQFKLNYFKFNEYDTNKKSAMPYALYCEFIEGRYAPRSFLLRLVTCPICLTVWCNIFLSVLGLIKFSSLGISIFFTWVLYHGLKIVVKKANE